LHQLPACCDALIEIGDQLAVELGALLTQLGEVVDFDVGVVDPDRQRRAVRAACTRETCGAGLVRLDFAADMTLLPPVALSRARTGYL
jgi:hypothetical protein